MKQFILAGLLLVLIGADSYGQYQTKKGRWMITHTVLSGGPQWYSSKSYEDGVLESSYKGKELNIYSAFTGPYWGGIDLYHEKIPTPKPAYKKETDFEFSIEPQIGYFIKDNLMIGATFLAGVDLYRSSEEDKLYKDNEWYIGAGPVARYYFGNNKKFRSFAGFESKAYIDKRKRTGRYINNNNQVKEYKDIETGFGFHVKPYAGYAMFLGKHWTADVHVAFMFERNDYKDKRRTYTDKVLDAGYPYTERVVDVNKILSLNVGIAYTF